MASGDTRPTVSVITISFRDLDGLKRTVDSVRAQRYGGRMEHIVIDGGSGDDVVEYLTKCEPGLTYWQSEPDGGRYDAMNQGIAHASGELLWFMHSADRFSDPDAVALAVEAISGHGPAREVWGYGMENLVGLGRVRGPIPFKIRKFLAGWQTIPHQASFFGSSLVRKLGGYDLEFGIAADQEFMLRAALLREPITVPRVLSDFDTSGAGTYRPPGEVFDDLRRLWDMHGRYPFRGRWLSRVYLRSWEYYLRCLGYVFGRSAKN
jgi:glycosyltransferase involved in cell wall biosynthesis